ERRAARAEALAQESASGGEALRFAAGLYRAQGRLAAAVDALHPERGLSGRPQDDAPRLLRPPRRPLALLAAPRPPPPAQPAPAARRAGPCPRQRGARGGLRAARRLVERRPRHERGLSLAGAAAPLRADAGGRGRHTPAAAPPGPLPLLRRRTVDRVAAGRDR